MIPWWLRAVRPREQERERDSKLSAHLGTPALSTNLKATAYCKNVMGGGVSEDGGNRHEKLYAYQLTFSLFPMLTVVVYFD